MIFVYNKMIITFACDHPVALINVLIFFYFSSTVSRMPFDVKSGDSPETECLISHDNFTSCRPGDNGFKCLNTKTICKKSELLKLNCNGKCYSACKLIQYLLFTSI